MLSRVAENIYWMARYIERAENAARLVNVNTNLLLDLPSGLAPGWAPLINICGANEIFYKRYKEAGERQAIKFLIADEDNPGSILTSLKAARENCRTIRDIVPREAWERLNELYLFAREELHQGLSKRGRHAYLRTIIQSAQTITGMLAGTMNHDAGYQFLRSGRNLERADMTSRIIDVRTANLIPEQDSVRSMENLQWMSVLKSLTAYQMYRQSRQTNISRKAVLSFLFKSTVFPRSINHCLSEISRSLSALQSDDEPLEEIDQLRQKVLDTEVGALSPANLHEYVDELQQDFNRLHIGIASCYFLPEEALEMVQVQVQA